VCIDYIIVLFNFNDARINIINARINAIDARINSNIDRSPLFNWCTDHFRRNIARINWYEDISNYFTMFTCRELTCAIKEVGSCVFQDDCAGCYNLLLTSSIPIPLVQTYCTCLTELNAVKKKMCLFKFWKGFVRTVCLLIDRIFF
jgi:hypothetical protein